jgi:hypothetical protein
VIRWHVILAISSPEKKLATSIERVSIPVTDTNRPPRWVDQV